MPSPPVRLPLNTLPTFQAVARHGNLRLAARSLHLTHSAVSQQIRSLEDQIGLRLFNRIGRGIVLNAAGRALLRSVETALAHLDEGVRTATATAGAGPVRIRLTLLPSFAQRWLLPRMARWREREPDIGIEIHTSQQLVELQREGFHAGIRQGAGRWKGLLSEPLIDAGTMVVVGSPQAARRLDGRPAAVLAGEALLGSPELWAAWFTLAGIATRVKPVAVFNDAGLLLQAVAQDLGVALVREILAADALTDGSIVRLSGLAMPGEPDDGYWLAYPPSLRDWPPLAALRGWIRDELTLSQQRLPVERQYPLLR